MISNSEGFDSHIAETIQKQQVLDVYNAVKKDLKMHKVYLQQIVLICKKP